MIPCQSPSSHFLRNFSVTFIIVPLLLCFLLLFPALFPQAHKRKSFLSASRMRKAIRSAFHSFFSSVSFFPFHKHAWNNNHHGNLHWERTNEKVNYDFTLEEQKKSKGKIETKQHENWRKKRHGLKAICEWMNWKFHELTVLSRLIRLFHKLRPSEKWKL